MVNEKYQLIPELLSRSHSKMWSDAKKEWQLKNIYYLDNEPQSCLCGHYPIKEVCVLINNITGSIAEVGNCCVQKFFSLDANYKLSSVFQSLKRISKDISKSVNLDTIRYAEYLCIWNKKNIDFYLDTYRKHKLSKKQSKYRQDLNLKLLQTVLKKQEMA